MRLFGSQHRVLFTAWILCLVIGAAGRLHSLESLSPPDLAFFHQASWSAVHGYGFDQTALEFDRGTLLGSMHLSLVRLLWLPLHWLAPRVETLVVLQALSVGVAGLAALRLGQSHGGGSGLWSRGVVLLCPFFPLLATVDLRPLVFLLPAYAFSYYFCAQTWIYLLLRRAADRIGLDYMDEPDDAPPAKAEAPALADESEEADAPAAADEEDEEEEDPELAAIEDGRAAETGSVMTPGALFELVSAWLAGEDLHRIRVSRRRYRTDGHDADA